MIVIYTLAGAYDNRIIGFVEGELTGQSVGGKVLEKFIPLDTETLDSAQNQLQELVSDKKEFIILLLDSHDNFDDDDAKETYEEWKNHVARLGSGDIADGDSMTEAIIRQVMFESIKIEVEA